MIQLLKTSIWAFCCLVCTAITGQRFVCDGAILVSTYDGNATTIASPVYIPFSDPFLSPVARYRGENFDALGFNAEDNYIYAVRNGTNSIVRLKRDNSFEEVGKVGFVDTLAVAAGDCTGDGRYVIYEQSLRKLLIYEVVDGFELLDSIDLYWDQNSGEQGSFESLIYDLAISPSSPNTAVTYQGAYNNPNLGPATTVGSLLKININSSDANAGMVTPSIKLNPQIVTNLGGLLYLGGGQLHGFGSDDLDSIPKQKTLYSINQGNGNSRALMRNQGGFFSDACACPFSFLFNTRIPKEGIYCSNDQKTFYLDINNGYPSRLENVTLRDTFADGLVIDEVTGLLPGSFDQINGIGTSILEITGLDIPANTNVEVSILINSVDAAVGSAYNQAFLYDMPLRFGKEVPSDETATSGESGDASIFSIIAISLEDVKWEVKTPTDCIVANDGEIKITSPDFSTGQKYGVKLQNQIGWANYEYTVEVDSDRALTLDSLYPGEYKVSQIRLLSENCSVAIRGDKIILPAPNDLLSLALTSNTPVCEGNDIELNALMSPVSDILWRGPNVFGAEDLQPLVVNAGTAAAGSYRAKAEYGYCVQNDTIEVEVKREVKVEIEGDSTVCARSILNLYALDQEDSLTYAWDGPELFSSNEKAVLIDSISYVEGGEYRLIASNGACADTAFTNVVVLESPLVDLDPLLEIDFCDDVILSPQILGEVNANYLWSPVEGLSCSDCASPQVLPIVQDAYQLVVVNDNGCVDSAVIEVALDKSNLVSAPNVILLDNVGLNGKFRLYPGCLIQEIRGFRIFDRWGSVVFNGESSIGQTSSDSWYGRISAGTGDIGVYVWTAEVVLVDGSIEYLAGDVTLLRRR